MGVSSISFLFIPPLIIFYCILLLILIVAFIYWKDKKQKQHSILKTHPILGRIRYAMEMIGPEFRQYWFLSDKEGKPVDRDTQEAIAKAGKYGNTVIGFGSKRDFSLSGFYLANGQYPKNMDELKVDNKENIQTYIYEILHEGLISRKEKRVTSELKPWYLHDDHAIIIGKNSKTPFKVKGLVGVSAMSYGALSRNAVTALSQGVAISGGSWMNTGEGGISPFHLTKLFVINSQCIPKEEKELKIYHFIKKKGLASNFELQEKFGDEIMDCIPPMVQQGFLIKRQADLIFQVGSGLFGARDENGYSEEVFLNNALKEEVKAIEIKMGQGAKTRGGKLPAAKNTPEIAKIRGVKPYTTVDSPNRFPLFTDTPSLFSLIKKWKEITGKPVGIKVVAGSPHSFEELASYMKETGEGPDFITIDGGEGGTGATTQEMADSIGLPLYSGLMILDDTLKKHGVRDRVVIIAAGMLALPDKMAIALGLGADLINVARAAMNTIGCINAHKCHTNQCPTGVTSHHEHLQAGLVVEEKRFRTANYLTKMRAGLFELASACELESPVFFERKHITFKNEMGISTSLKDASIFD